MLKIYQKKKAKERWKHIHTCTVHTYICIYTLLSSVKERIKKKKEKQQHTTHFAVSTFFCTFFSTTQCNDIYWWSLPNIVCMANRFLSIAAHTRVKDREYNNNKRRKKSKKYIITLDLCGKAVKMKKRRRTKSENRLQQKQKENPFHRYPI